MDRQRLQRRGSVILALDQGTSATKACVYAPPGRLLGSASVPVGRHVTGDGGVEQDPHELVESCREAARRALRAAGLTGGDVLAAALANQGESFALFTAGGEPKGPVIGWQDGRCGDVIARLDAAGARESIEARTGLPLHAEFTAPKLAHRLSLVDGDVRFGTLDTWLIHQLDPLRPHVTDRATASRTMLIGLGDDDWSDDLLELFGIPRHLLPEIVPCDARVAGLELDGHTIPLHASGYDMGLALLGHGCVEPGDSKATFGTCLGAMTATQDPSGADGLLSAIAYTRAGAAAYALDGEISAAGSLVEWAIRVGVAGSPAELEALASSVEDAGGAVLVPAIDGLGAPHWRDGARARLVGMSSGFDRRHFARAVFDAIAWSLRDVVEALGNAGLAPAELRVDGGLAESRLLLQRCADCCGVPLVRARQPEATAYGAAALAMLALDVADLDAIVDAARGDELIEPVSAPPAAEAERWRAAVAEELRAFRGAA